MKNKGVFLIYLMIFSMLGCHDKTQESTDAEQPLTAYFPRAEPADTLHFEVVDDRTWKTAGDTLPHHFFQKHLKALLMNEVSYLDSSGDMEVRAGNRFPLTDRMDACLVNISQGWYRHRSLFVFDQQQQTFNDRVTVAEFYGGEGGQLLTASYLVDVDGDGDRDLVLREMEHWLILEDNEPRDSVSEWASLLRWQEDGFKPVPSDTAMLVRQFPMEGMW